MNNYLKQENTSYENQKFYQKKTGGIKLAERLILLRRLQNLLSNNKILFENAAQTDLAKSDNEFTLSEFIPVIHEIKNARKNLKRWTRAKKVKKRIPYLTYRGYIRYEPKGVVLIISPWNFPFLLSLKPLISALAAGNSIILKPSELSPATSSALADFFNTHFDPELIRVETGDAQTVIDLQKNPFNHIYFTGSSAIGKKVMEAASRHLASVTLELGGKSPVIVDKGTDLTDTAEKIVAGKFLNCGQTCIAPDYVFVHRSEHEEFLKTLKSAIHKFYYKQPGSIKNNPDYSRIINFHHFTRVQKLFDDAVSKGASVVIGGNSDPTELMFEPTVLTDVHIESEIMNEEIFGPVLPVLTYEKESEVIDIILSKPRPLSMYIFSKNKKNIRHYLNRIISGNVAVNEVIVQFIHPELPFGGVNNSGFGNSHGFYGYKAFSHERSILMQGRWFSISRFMAPPYGKLQRTAIRFSEKFLG